MDDQVTLFPDTSPRQCCDTCKHYSALAEPRDVSDGAFIYGYCFKYGVKPYSLGMGKGLAVFIHESSCESFKRRKKADA